MKSHTFPAILALLLSLLLTSCGSTFWKVPYYVGVRTPTVKDAEGDYNHVVYMNTDWKIHRIGPEYYAEMELYYFPHEMHTRIFWNVFCGDHTPGINDARTPARRIRFCKLTEQERKDLKLPALPPAGGKTLPSEMTAKQAAKLQPVYVCTKRRDGLPENLDMEDRYTWAHYAMLPVTGVTFVVLDLPCDIIGGVAPLSVMVLVHEACSQKQQEPTIPETDHE